MWRADGSSVGLDAPRVRPVIRPCLRCHEPLLPDLDVLEDARRWEITLDFLPLRCRHAHTERLLFAPQPRTRYVPACGYCGQAVMERKRNGKTGVLHHPACAKAARGKRATREHGLVEVEA